jgi:hypothetical protein
LMGLAAVWVRAAGAEEGGRGNRARHRQMNPTGDELTRG